MKRIISLIALLILGAMLMTTTVGCNTIGGMGEDIESGGGAIEEEAED
ncbi:MAG: entericidin A/B family lipoprotein [Desulfovermiculus sp.]